MSGVGAHLAASAITEVILLCNELLGKYAVAVILKLILRGYEQLLKCIAGPSGDDVPVSAPLLAVVWIVRCPGDCERAPAMRKAFLRQVRRFPWATNVTLYGCLFAGGDFVHQWFSRKEEMDWRHTRNVAVVAFSFHGNFNFFWMRFLERRFPGNSAGMVLRKLLLDQTTAAPLATSVFYTGQTHSEHRVAHGPHRAVNG